MAKHTRPDLRERFWSKVDKDGPNGCWIWTGGRWNTGYGRFWLSHEECIGAHRYAYMSVKGDIPEGLHLDHICRTPLCVNPDHLEPVTPAENVHRSPIAPAAVNARKTHCKRGHPLSGENLYTHPTGKRQCRTCRRVDSLRRYYASKAAA